MPEQDPKVVETEATIEKDFTPVLGGEPALVISILVGAVLAILAVVHVVDVNTSTAIVTSLAPVAAGILTRFNVRPVVK